MRELYPTGPAWDGLGVNYGSDVVYGLTPNLTQARIDLKAIAGRMNRIRFHVPPANVTPRVINNCLQVIDMAKDMGLKVVWGCTSNGSTLTAANWLAYHDATVARAIQAQDHGIDDYNTGNEDEYRIDGTTLPIGTYRANQNALAGVVKSVFSNTTSYVVSQNHTFGWITLGLGNFDKIGLNVYGDSATDPRYFVYILSTFYKAFGAKMYISEFNIADSWADLDMNEMQQKRALRNRIRYIRTLGVEEAYFFTYAHNTTEDFALRLADGRYRLMWDLFSAGRPVANRG